MRKKIYPSVNIFLLRHTWPGHVRELQNPLTRAAVWSIYDEIDAADVRDALLPALTNWLKKYGLD